LVISKYTLYWLLSPIGRAAIEQVASSSSGLNTLSISKVQGLPIPLATLEEQKEIVKRIEGRLRGWMGWRGRRRSRWLY